jgi:hypothetical protein
LHIRIRRLFIVFQVERTHVLEQQSRIAIAHFPIFELPRRTLTNDSQPRTIKPTCTNTATTRCHSSSVNFCGLSITRYMIVSPLGVRRCMLSSFARFAPCARHASLVTNFNCCNDAQKHDTHAHTCRIGRALYIVIRLVVDAGIIISGVRLTRLFCVTALGTAASTKMCAQYTKCAKILL